MVSKVLSPATPRAAISMHGSQSRTEAETAAFGYPARALVFKQRVRKSDLWLSATCAVVTASDGLALPSRGGDFRSRSIDDGGDFLGNPGNRAALNAGANAPCVSVHGTKRTWRDVRLGSAMRAKADIGGSCCLTFELAGSVSAARHPTLDP